MSGKSGGTGFRGSHNDQDRQYQWQNGGRGGGMRHNDVGAQRLHMHVRGPMHIRNREMPPGYGYPSPSAGRPAPPPGFAYAPECNQVPGQGPVFVPLSATPGPPAGRPAPPSAPHPSEAYQGVWDPHASNSTLASYTQHMDAYGYADPSQYTSSTYSGMDAAASVPFDSAAQAQWGASPEFSHPSAAFAPGGDGLYGSLHPTQYLQPLDTSPTPPAPSGAPEVAPALPPGPPPDLPEEPPVPPPAPEVVPAPAAAGISASAVPPSLEETPATVHRPESVAATDLTDAAKPKAVDKVKKRSKIGATLAAIGTTLEEQLQDPANKDAASELSKGIEAARIEGSPAQPGASERTDNDSTQNGAGPSQPSAPAPASFSIKSNPKMQLSSIRQVNKRKLQNINVFAAAKPEIRVPKEEIPPAVAVVEPAAVTAEVPVAQGIVTSEAPTVAAENPTANGVDLPSTKAEAVKLPKPDFKIPDNRPKVLKLESKAPNMSKVRKSTRWGVDIVHSDSKSPTLVHAPPQLVRNSPGEPASPGDPASPGANKRPPQITSPGAMEGPQDPASPKSPAEPRSPQKSPLSKGKSEKSDRDVRRGDASERKQGQFGRDEMPYRSRNRERGRDRARSRSRRRARSRSLSRSPTRIDRGRRSHSRRPSRSGSPLSPPSRSPTRAQPSHRHDALSYQGQDRDRERRGDFRREQWRGRDWDRHRDYDSREYDRGRYDGGRRRGEYRNGDRDRGYSSYHRDHHESDSRRREPSLERRNRYGKSRGRSQKSSSEDGEVSLSPKAKSPDSRSKSQTSDSNLDKHFAKMRRERQAQNVAYEPSRLSKPSRPSRGVTPSLPKESKPKIAVGKAETIQGKVAEEHGQTQKPAVKASLAPSKGAKDDKFCEFEAGLKVRVNAIFAFHQVGEPGLDLKARCLQVDQIHEQLYNEDNTNQILTFQAGSDMEYLEEPQDDLAILGDPSSLGLASWTEHPLVKLDGIPQLPKAAQWQVREEPDMIPWSPSGATDPRGANYISAFAEPHIMALSHLSVNESPPRPADSKSCTWAGQSSDDDVEDDAISGVPPPPSDDPFDMPPLPDEEPPGPPDGGTLQPPLPPTGPPPPGPPPAPPAPGWPPGPLLPASGTAAHQAATGQLPAPSSRSTSRQTLRPEPESGRGWRYIDATGALSEMDLSLNDLRQSRTEHRPDGGPCAFRKQDNLWLPINQNRFSSQDLIWKGAHLAPSRQPPAPASMPPSGLAANPMPPKVSLGLPIGGPNPSMQTTNAVPDQRGEGGSADIKAQAERDSLPDRRTKLISAIKRSKLNSEKTLKAMLTRLMARQGAKPSLATLEANVIKKRKALKDLPRLQPDQRPSKRMRTEKEVKPVLAEKLTTEGPKPAAYGPLPPVHVPAMLKGRLALRLLSGKEGETLIARMVEDAFEKVMGSDKKKALEEEERQRAERARIEAEEKAERERMRRKEKEEKERLRKIEEDQKRAQAKQAQKLRQLQEEEQEKERKQKERAEMLKASQRQAEALKDQKRQQASQNASMSKAPPQNSDMHARNSTVPVSPHKGGGTRQSLQDPGVGLSAGPSLQPEPGELSAVILDPEQPSTKPPPEGEGAKSKVLDAEKRIARGKRKVVNSDSDDDYDPGGALQPSRPSKIAKKLKGKSQAVSIDDSLGLSDDGDEPSISDASGPVLENGSDKEINLPGNNQEPQSKAASKLRDHLLHFGNLQGIEDENLRQRVEQLQQGWYKTYIPIIAGELLEEMRKFDSKTCGSLFAKPVDLDEYTDYRDFVEQPMDLTTLSKIWSKGPASMQELDRWKQEMLLIPANAQQYGVEKKFEYPTEVAREFENHFWTSFDKKSKEMKYELESYVLGHPSICMSEP